MGFFDKMFGCGATEDEKSEKNFARVRQKDITVLNFADQQHVQFLNLHIDDAKLFVRAIVPSQDVATRMCDQGKLVNPNLDDITLDLQVAEQKTQSAAATAQQPGSVQTPEQATYTVQSGDTLSKISKRFYGNANDYMRIFYANRDKLRDPNKIQV